MVAGACGRHGSLAAPPVGQETNIDRAPVLSHIHKMATMRALGGTERMQIVIQWSRVHVRSYLTLPTNTISVI